MDPTLQYLLDRTQIVETIIRYFTALDTRDFFELRRTLDDTIDVDFSLLSGKPGVVHKSDDFAVFVAKSLGDAPLTQHLSANHVVTLAGDKADATASLYAWHQAPPEGEGIGTLRGAYGIGLVRAEEGWRINKLHMTSLWAKPDQAVSLTE